MAKSLADLVRQCGNGKVPGVKARIYHAAKGDFASWPTVGTGAYGADKVYTGNFSFVSGKAWGVLDVLVATGEVTDTIQGEVGGQYIRNGLPFFIEGDDKEQRKKADELMANSGCLIYLVPTKDGKMVVVGTPDDPCFLEQLTLSTGGPENARKGTAYRFFSDTGVTSMLYEGTIDVDDAA